MMALDRAPVYVLHRDGTVQDGAEYAPGLDPSAERLIVDHHGQGRLTFQRWIVVTGEGALVAYAQTGAEVHLRALLDLAGAVQ